MVTDQRTPGHFRGIIVAKILISTRVVIALMNERGCRTVTTRIATTGNEMAETTRTGIDMVKAGRTRTVLNDEGTITLEETKMIPEMDQKTGPWMTGQGTRGTAQNHHSIGIAIATSGGIAETERAHRQGDRATTSMGSSIQAIWRTGRGTDVLSVAKTDIPPPHVVPSPATNVE